VYGTGPLRHEQRSTAAHNTVVVDGENSSEVWGGFRVARRAYPVQVSLSNDGNDICISASHSGYLRLPGNVRHTRSWKISSNQFSVRDEVIGKCDSIKVFLHFHPVCRANYPRMFLHDGSALLFSSAISPTTCTTYWHPEFGLSIKTERFEFALTHTDSLSNEFTCTLEVKAD